MKQITIAGTVGKDAITRRTGNGDPVTSWPVAVEERNGREKRTLWFDVSMWGKRGEALGQFIGKGTRICVSGEFSTREHEGKTYLTLRADQVTLMGGGEQRDDRAGRDPARQAPAGGRSVALDDEIPFSMEWR